MHKIKQLSDKRIKPDLLDNFLNFINDELELDTPYSVYFVEDKDNASEALGKTAMYNPSTKSVYVYVTNRHPKDIFRSIAHELVHHKQHCSGELENMSLEKAEIDANAGGYYLRKFEDQLKENRLQEETKKCPPGYTLRGLGKVGDTSSEFCLPSKLSWKDDMDRWSVKDILDARSALWKDDFSGATDRKQGYQIKKPNPIEKEDKSFSRDIIRAIGRFGTGESKGPIKKLIQDPFLIYKLINMFSSLRTAPRPPEDYIDNFNKAIRFASFDVRKPDKPEKPSDTKNKEQMSAYKRQMKIYNKKMDFAKNQQELMDQYSGIKEYFSGDFFPKTLKEQEGFNLGGFIGDLGSRVAAKTTPTTSTPAREEDRGSFAPYSSRQLKAAQAIYRAAGIGGGEIIPLLSPEKRKEFLEDPKKFRENPDNVKFEKPDRKPFNLSRKISEKELRAALKDPAYRAELLGRSPGEPRPKIERNPSVELPPDLIKKFADYYSRSTQEKTSEKGEEDFNKRAREIYSVSPFTFKSQAATKKGDERREAVLNAIFILSMLPLPITPAIDAFLAIYYMEKYAVKNKDTTFTEDFFNDPDLQMAILQTLVAGLGTKGLVDAARLRDAQRTFGLTGALHNVADNIKKGALKIPATRATYEAFLDVVDGFRIIARTMKDGFTDIASTVKKFNADKINNRLIEPGLRFIERYNPEFAARFTGKGQTKDVVALRALSRRMMDLTDQLSYLFVGRGTEFAKYISDTLGVKNILTITKESAAGKRIISLLETNITNVQKALDDLARTSDEFIEYLYKNHFNLYNRIFEVAGEAAEAGAYAVKETAKNAKAADVAEAFFIYLQYLADKNPVLSQRIAEKIFGRLIAGKNATKFALDGLLDLVVAPVKKGEKGADEINKLINELLFENISPERMAELTELILTKKGLISGGKLTEEGAKLLAQRMKNSIADIVAGGAKELTPGQKALAEVVEEVQEQVYKLYASQALKKFGALKGAGLVAGRSRAFAAFIDRVLSPDAFLGLGIAERAWVRYVMGNRIATRMIGDLASLLRKKFPASGIAKFAAATLEVMEAGFSFVMFKMSIPAILYTKVYGPNCGITFGQYLEYFQNSTFSKIFPGKTTYDISAARREFNKKVDEVFDEKKPGTVSIQNIFGLPGCKHVRDLVETGKLDNEEIRKKVRQIKKGIKQAALKAEQQAKVAAKKAKEALKKQVDEEFKRQLGSDYKEKVPAIMQKVKDRKQLTKEEKEYLKRVQAIQKKQGKIFQEFLKQQFGAAAERINKEFKEGAKNVIDAEEVKKLTRKLKSKAKKPSSKASRLEESVSAKTDLLSERLIKVSIGLTK